MYDELEMLEMEDYEDFEDYEDYEDWEDFEDFEDLEDWEDYEDFEYYEADPFLGNIFKTVSRVARQVPWGDVIRTGTRVISSMQNEQEAFDEMAYMAELAAETESEAEADQFLGAIAGLASSVLPMLMKESDYEDYEDYEDFEDGEGDPFLGALLPVAANLLPAAIPFVKKGIQAIGKAMRESDPSGQSVKALPKIAKDATKKLARQAKAGKPITKKTVAKALASSTRKTLANPKKAAAAIKANRKAAKRAMKRSSAKGKLTKKALRRKRLLRAR